jgi:hypothetical protein
MTKFIPKTTNIAVFQNTSQQSKKLHQQDVEVPDGAKCFEAWLFGFVIGSSRFFVGHDF